ncbi:hypothetical protein ATN81_26755 [Agrobacterium pusense]|nr:hypothetical protein ATN81_26755 [Agrobacterium pusense]OJH59956.1 hypothetical protein BA725_10080 [Agrobacterium pusense]
MVSRDGRPSTFREALRELHALRCNGGKAGQLEGNKVRKAKITEYASNLALSYSVEKILNINFQKIVTAAVRFRCKLRT